MAEEEDEDDCGITIKIEAPSSAPSRTDSNAQNSNHNETTV